MTKRIGCVNYACEQGLGRLTKLLFDIGVIDEVMVVEHKARPTQWNWYDKDVERTGIRPFDTNKAMAFCNKFDAMLFIETPFQWTLIPHCRRRGIRTVLMPMFECMPKQLPYVPDAYINTSDLDAQYYPDNSTRINVPAQGIPWRRRERAEVFVHNAGHGGLNRRNGTGELIDAMGYVDADIELILRSQKPLEWDVSHEPRIKKYVGTFPFDSLYSEGDVFVFPEKFNGLSLPIAEAVEAGMVAMVGDRLPMNCWLPKEPLIPVSRYDRDSVSRSCHEFDSAVFDPVTIAAKIDEFAHQPIGELSDFGKRWAEANSPEKLVPLYRDYILEGKEPCPPEDLLVRSEPVG